MGAFSASHRHGNIDAHRGGVRTLHEVARTPMLTRVRGTHRATFQCMCAGSANQSNLYHKYHIVMNQLRYCLHIVVCSELPNRRWAGLSACAAQRGRGLLAQGATHAVGGGGAL